MNPTPEELPAWCPHWRWNGVRWTIAATRERIGHAICYLYDQWYSTDLRTLRKLYNGREDLVAQAQFYNWEPGW